MCLKWVKEIEGRIQIRTLTHKILIKRRWMLSFSYLYFLKTSHSCKRWILSWRRPLSYRNQSINLLCHERVKGALGTNGLRIENGYFWTFSTIQHNLQRIYVFYTHWCYKSLSRAPKLHAPKIDKAISCRQPLNA